MKKVLIPTRLDPVCRTTLEAHGGFEVCQDDRESLEHLATAHPDTVALIVRSEPVTPGIIDALPSLKLILRAGAGVNTIDTRYARRKGIDVMNTPGANANAVAEEVVAMLLADARHIVRADASCRAGEWEKKAFLGRELAEKTVGIVGLGAIGRLVARRLSGFDVELLGYDPFLSEDRAEDIGVRMTDLPTLFAQSDYVTLHLPENDETRNLVDADLLSQMKHGATLVNCARAGVVREEALRAIKADRGLRFLNDVYPKDAPGLKSVSDVADLMLPHLGANTVEANRNAARRAAEQLIEFYDKGITSFIVNRDIPEGLDPAFGDLAFTLARIARQVVGRDEQLELIETSFYGSLKPYGEWLLIPIAAALSETIDRSSDVAAVRRVLKESGIDYADRETDERKGYRNSMTVDLVAGLGDDRLRRASVRGTVTEGRLMVARINDFDKLYFEPKGHIAVFIYRDRPGVLGRIASAMADADVNIDDVRNPHNARGDQSIAVLKVNQAVPAGIMARTAADIEATTAFCLHL